MNTYLPPFSYNDVIDINDQNVLVQIGENDTANCFAIGDIVNRNWEQAIHNGWDKPVKERDGSFVTRDFVCAAAKSNVRNKSKRTIRYYADVSSFFPQAVRDEFDVLSFSHFAHARKYDDWFDYLEYARDGLCSVEACEIEWEKRAGGQTPPPAPEPEEEERPNQVENKFSFHNVCVYAVNLLDRFHGNPKIKKAIELINEAIAEPVETK